jgi:hypothetical protein
MSNPQEQADECCCVVLGIMVVRMVPGTVHSNNTGTAAVRTVQYCTVRTVLCRFLSYRYLRAREHRAPYLSHIIFAHFSQLAHHIIHFLHLILILSQGSCAIEPILHTNHVLDLVYRYETKRIMSLDPSVLSSKRVVYVGGLADQVTVDLLRAAMIPFGPIKSVEMVSHFISLRIFYS